MGMEIGLMILGLLAVSAGCLAPAAMLPPLPNDKLLHFLAFGGLTLLAGRIASTGTELVVWTVCLFAGGWLIECIQNWIPGRRFCWKDLLANTAGIAAASIISVSAIGR
ncbi:VanZ family protein [Noviherbaspirillum sp.]|uniref:VanZ family protein n=1 Tax=Noviherbaspirillum sp. TaxID=1926288 RepID=UPI002FE41D23